MDDSIHREADSINVLINNNHSVDGNEDPDVNFG